MSILRRLKKKTVQSILKDRTVIPIVSPMSEESVFCGKTALVTGGTGGIGLAIVDALVARGCNVIVGGTNQEKLDSVKQKYDNNANAISVAHIDYSDINKLELQLSKILNEAQDVHYFISSAGVHTENASFWDITPEEYDRVMDINLRGAFFASRIVAESMINRRVDGKIVFVSSSRGSEPAWSPYGLSKWGLNGFTLGLAQQLSSQCISVNSIAPGTTATSLIGYREGDGIETTENRYGRMVLPEEVASLVISVLLDSSGLLSGEVLHLSGGRGLFDLR